jgi:hypothetical protein
MSRSYVLALMLCSACVVPQPSGSPAPQYAGAPIENEAAPSEPAGGGGGDGGEWELRPRRVLVAGQHQGGMSEDGDYMTWEQFGDGPQCGLLYKKHPGEALFLICDGQLAAGPLTTEAQVQELYQFMQQQLAEKVEMRMSQSRMSYEIGRSVRAAFPDGCAACKYKIYDQNGNFIRNE